jgi:hypothetical protein
VLDSIRLAVHSALQSSSTISNGRFLTQQDSFRSSAGFLQGLLIIFVTFEKTCIYCHLTPIVVRFPRLKELILLGNRRRQVPVAVLIGAKVGQRSILSQ